MATKTDRLISDVNKLNDKVERLSTTLTWGKGFLAALCLIAGFVWWFLGAKIDQMKDELLGVRSPISQPAQSQPAPRQSLDH